MVIKLERDELEEKIKKEYWKSYLAMFVALLIYLPVAYFFLWDGSMLVLFLNVLLSLLIVIMVGAVYFFERIHPLNKKLWEYEWEYLNFQ